MRLFIAINFDEKIKDQLEQLIHDLKHEGVLGRPTRRNNLHLTLAFIGESDRQEDIQQIMAEIKTKPFNLRIAGLGKFRNNILWAGIHSEQELFDMQKTLVQGLNSIGLNIDSRKYSPHLTLLREFQNTNLDALPSPDINFYVQNISLMKSERLNGVLTYTELYRKELTEEV